MPPITPPSNTKRIIGTVLVVSIVLIGLIMAVIWKSTTAMFQARSSDGYATVQTGMMGYAESAPVALYANDAVVSKGMMVPPIAPQPGGATADDRARIGEKIIRNGSLTLRVDNATKRMEELRAIVTNAKGFVSSANVVDNANVKTATVTVRIPNDKFDEVRRAAKALASTVFVESENSDDVTAQFVDLDARLNAAKAEEQQYLEILKKSGSIEDTLAVTEQLSRVRANIEQLQGQMRYMNDQTSYATLNITLTEEAKVEAPSTVWKPLETFNIAARGLVQSLQNLADTLITAGVFIVGLLVPIVLVCWLIGWIVWRVIRLIIKK
ncbi:MAG: DUF4349 domain-containing protein [Candidatus Uhrbacteria bacterium]